ncbi:hypothetical protein LZ554_008187 [Drepanopeziza brunnea f. sp. 'monogermtubi']|nr:hypothetical protein LZ554_008187 [Drepanopeziza brunnea f. sp. 'monogermtubi']
MDHQIFVFHRNAWVDAWQPPAPKKKGAGRNPKEVTERMKLLNPGSYIRKLERSLRKKSEEMAMGLQKMQEEGQRPEEIRKYVKKKGNEEQKIVREIKRLKGLRDGAEAGPAGPVVDPVPAPVPGQMAGQWAYPAWPIVDPAPVPGPMPGQMACRWAYLGVGPQPNEHAAQYYDAGAHLGWQQPQFAAAPPEAAIWPIPGDIGSPILVADEPVLAAEEQVAVADEPILFADNPIFVADVPWIEPQPPAEWDPERFLGKELDWMAMETS